MTPYVFIATKPVPKERIKVKCYIYNYITYVETYPYLNNTTLLWLLAAKNGLKKLDEVSIS